MGRRPRIFIVSGPSGSGKTTVVEYLIEALPETLFSVSHTTRSPRPGEVNGREYHFVSGEEFHAMIGRGEFLEHDHHFGNWYGTHSSNLERAAGQGKDILLDVDVEGARQIKEKMPEAVAILFIPPSREVLESRLRSRGQDDEEVIVKRLERARQEISRYQGYDYLVVNDKLEEARAQVRAILCAERADSGGACRDGLAQARERAAAARRGNNQERVSAILETFRQQGSKTG